MFVIQSAIVKGLGGIATAVAHYERMFRDVGVGSTVLFAGPGLDALRALGCDVIEAPKLLTSPIAGALPVLSNLRAELLERAMGKPIVVVVHSDLSLPALKRLLPHGRFVTPCHSDKFKHKERADLVITLNAAQDTAARAALSKPRIAHLGNPYVIDPPRPLALEGTPRLNFVARFTPTKDPLALVRATALLPAPAPLRFFGDGELVRDARDAAAALGLNAEFAGWHEAPFSQFHRSDILVSPAQWEGLPYLLQEALDHGVPVVASDIAGNRAALNEGEFGLLYKLGDDNALASALKEALANRDILRGKAAKGRAVLRTRYGATAFWGKLTAELAAAGG